MEQKTTKKGIQNQSHQLPDLVFKWVMNIKVHGEKLYY